MTKQTSALRHCCVFSSQRFTVQTCHTSFIVCPDFDLCQQKRTQLSEWNRKTNFPLFTDSSGSTTVRDNIFLHPILGRGEPQCFHTPRWAVRNTPWLHWIKNNLVCLLNNFSTCILIRPNFLQKIFRRTDCNLSSSVTRLLLASARVLT